MALTNIEKCAGKWFRLRGEQALAEAWQDFPDSVKCSNYARFFRHECRQQAGRTRSIELRRTSLVSGEIWVTWDGDDLEVISQERADKLVAEGEIVEVEQVLAGKFEFSWASGKCGSCGLTVLGGEGNLKDARPLPAQRQDDLAGFSQGMPTRTTPGLQREHSD